MTIDECKAISRGMVEREYSLACIKHPGFSGGSIDRALTLMVEEVGEVAEAIKDGSIVELETEIAQVAAVCLRMLELVMKS